MKRSSWLLLGVAFAVGQARPVEAQRGPKAAASRAAAEAAEERELPNVDIVAAGDVNRDLRDRIQSEFGVPRVYGSWQEMIATEELDIVQAASENNACADIVEAAAARGAPIVAGAGGVQTEAKLARGAGRHLQRIGLGSWRSGSNVGSAWISLSICARSA